MIVTAKSEVARDPPDRCRLTRSWGEPVENREQENQSMPVIGRGCQRSTRCSGPPTARGIKKRAERRQTDRYRAIGRDEIAIASDRRRYHETVARVTTRKHNMPVRADLRFQRGPKRLSPHG